MRASKLLRTCSSRINHWHLTKYSYATLSGNVNKFSKRSHNCGELSTGDVGKNVELYGWVQYTRFDNKIISLRDSYGSIQCVVDRSKLTKEFRKRTIQNESVIKIIGLVQARPKSQVNEKLPSGAIEVLAKDIEMISPARNDMPILTRESNDEHTLVNKLRYRYLDIRQNSMQEALRFRSKVYEILRQKLYNLDFVECETPTLFRRTPGGANEFIVPTRIPGMFYGLTQSPQQLKQLLMIGGIDRYFQICRCYRDESGRVDRQPEFTQLDIELTFTNQNLVMQLIDELLFNLLSQLDAESVYECDPKKIFKNGAHSIKRVTYSEALKKYGTDKPDTRFEWLIESNEENQLYIVIPYQLSKNHVKDKLDSIKNDKKIVISNYKINEFSENGSTRILIDSQSVEARKILGELRVRIARDLHESGKPIYSDDLGFLWITDFPLFELDQYTSRLVSSHHPFTSPSEDSIHFLKTDPMRVKGQHYDLVLNGQEIGGGSIRIHDAELQQYIFKDILRLDEHTFSYFIEALTSGCPPHGGIAIGLDRLIAILLRRSSIRDVITFPKSGVGRDLMSSCPHEISQETKNMYHIDSLK